MKHKSWRKQAPKTNPDRQIVAKKCGAAKCFLDPKRLGYPICSKTSCKPSCQGLRAAFSRARQQHKRKVARRALIQACHMACPWVRRKHTCVR